MDPKADVLNFSCFGGEMQFTENCSILSAELGNGDIPLITVMNDGLAEERVQHTIPLTMIDGSWLGMRGDKVAPFLSAGIASQGTSIGHFVIVGWAGQVLSTSGRLTSRGAILRGKNHTSIVRATKTIDRLPYATGMKRQVYRSSKEGVWSAIDAGVVYDGDDDFVGFEAIGGFNGNEIYAAGTGGELWYAVDGRWEQVNGLTNVHLHALECAANEEVYVGGRLGVLMVGRGKTWKIVDLDIKETIWALQWYRDALYIFSDSGVYVMSGAAVSKIENDVVGEGGFYTICVGRDGMWCFARKKIAIFDGVAWKAVDCSLTHPIDSDLRGFFDNSVLEVGSPFLIDD